MKPQYILLTAPTTADNLETTCSLAQAQFSGQVVTVSNQRGSSANAEPDTHRFTPARLDESYRKLSCTSGRAILCIAPSGFDALCEFACETPGTLGDLHSIIITLTPREESQRGAITQIAKLTEAGMTPGQLRILRTGVPAMKSGQENMGWFETLDTYLSQNPQFINCSPNAVIQESNVVSALERAHFTIGDAMRETVNYESLLAEAHSQGAGEGELAGLVDRMILQRRFQALKPALTRALDMVLPQAIPSVTSHEQAGEERAAKPAAIEVVPESTSAGHFAYEPQGFKPV
ncbi:hypothetical protein M0D68_19315 [Paraburkholderia sp. SEWSISQ10-3 4]|uniref:hypothetical protein n=1 Tax=Paraburkholderia TaxID=1822464 RepID=UPI002256EFBF|nr:MULTISPECIES: hypothetical protein [Paraburkholderia]MCX4140354.1 hypothetical protein [Paraburkholderia aspalathi]MDN7173041.1 hypothetical protein [Paraburkholderia sp. SEWSISQ10-3 4]MDQ6502680.1 hypothetical protein [Paraburkholderia aspalathi]